MYLYVLFFLLFIFSSMEIVGVKFKFSHNFYLYIYITFIALFFLLSSIRWETGTDWMTYYDYYIYVGNYNDIGWMEPLFGLLNKINARYFCYQIQIMEIAALSIIPIGFRYQKLSPYPLMTLFIWYCVIFAHIFPVRQTIAISLIVFGWKYIELHQLKKYLVICLIAILFHYSAIIALPLYWLWHIRLSTKIISVLIICFAILAIASTNTISNVLYAVGGSFFEEKLSTYMGDADNNFGMQFTVREVLIRGIINRSIILFTALFLLNDKRQKDNRLNAIINIYAFSFLLFIIITPLSVALGRLTIFSDMSQALLIPYIFTLKMNRFTLTILLSILLIYFLYRFQGIINNYHDYYIPYKSFLSL